MTSLLLAFGLVFVFEGLALALAPSRMEQLLQTLSKIPLETRRLFGLAAVGFGVTLVAVVRAFGG